MENSNLSRNRHGEHLGVNQMGKNIKKSPLHQPNFTNNPKQQPQPQVYNISKNDFRSIVQQLTGSPSQDHLPRPPSQNQPKSPSMRLQKIRPPPLTPINRHHQISSSAPQPPAPPFPNVQAAESPTSAFMRYLQNSIIDSGPRPTQPPPFQVQVFHSKTHQLQSQAPIQPLPSSSSGLLPTPPTLPTPAAAAFPSSRGNVPALLPSFDWNHQALS